MIDKVDTTDMNVIFRKLSRKSQLHLLEMANTAFVAEQSVREELEKKQASKPA